MPGAARGWLVAAAIFILGLAIGIAGTALVGVRLVRQQLLSSPAVIGPADRVADRIGEDITKSLQLTPAESARVQTILHDAALNVKTTRARALVQAGEELRTAVERIAADLPPEKRAELRRLLLRRYERLGIRLPPLRATEP